jgi:hypothetical protein
MARRRFRKKNNNKVAKAVKTYVKKSLKNMSEVKRFDTIANGFAIPSVTAAVGINLSLMNQGSADYNRLGNSVKPVKFDFKIQVFSQANTNNQDLIRILIIQYKSGFIAGGTQPALTDILEDSNTAAGLGVLSGYKIENKDAYHVLLDKSQRINNAINIVGQPTNDMSYQLRQYHVPGRRLLKMQWQAQTAGAAASSGYGVIYMYIFSIAAGIWQCNYNAQLSYLDV